MKNLTKRLLYKGDNVARANVIWNIAGSFVYAFASMVLSFLVIRMAGEEKGGIFSFGYSTLGQQLFLVAYFGIRPFQITDGKGEYSFGEYREHRNMTCMLALVAGALFLTARTIAFRKGIGDYTAGKCMILLLLVIYKVIDGYADVYESEFQRQGCLYLTGKSNFFRTIFSVAVFTVTLGAFNHLLFACLMAVAAQAMGVFWFDLDVIHALDHVDWTITKGKVAKLFKNTGFLFVSVFLDFYIFSSAKYAIDAHMNNAASGYFNLIFMPTSVIYMVANFVIRPYLTTLTDLWTEEKITEFKKTLVRIAAVILGLTVLAVAGTLVLGKWALSIMELLMGGEKGTLTVYFWAFAGIVLGGGFYALANLMYYALIIMRKQKTVFFVYAAAAAAAFFLSGNLVGILGIDGAALCYLLLMAGETAGFGLCTVKSCRSEEKEIRQ